MGRLSVMNRFGVGRSLRLATVLAVVLTLGVIAGGGAVLAQSPDEYDAPHDRPGPAVDTIHYRSFNVDLAPQELQRDEMDMYIFNLQDGCCTGAAGRRLNRTV